MTDTPQHPDTGFLAPGADVAALLDAGRPGDLVALWCTYNRRALAARTLANIGAFVDRDAIGAAGKSFAAELARTSEVTAVQALAATTELARQAERERWLLIRDAREDGVSWAAIGAALGMTRQAAQQYYRTRLEHQETHAPDVHDSARARAALADDTAEEDR